MFKSFKFLLLFTLLLSCAQSLKSVDSEKIIVTPGQIRTNSNELKDNYSETIEIKFKCEDDKIIIGDKGIFHFKTDFNGTHIFNHSSIEKDTLFKTKVKDEKEKILMFHADYVFHQMIKLISFVI